MSRSAFESNTPILSYPSLITHRPGVFIQQPKHPIQWHILPLSAIIVVYGIINNGYYEGKQTHIAFEILENWCERVGIQFGGGIGQGAGEMLAILKNAPLNKGPLNNLGRALESLVTHIESGTVSGITYVSPYFPRFLWRVMATYTFWHPQAYKNGLTKKDILSRLEGIDG
jgi:hypothetical protein